MSGSSLDGDEACRESLSETDTKWRTQVVSGLTLLLNVGAPVSVAPRVRASARVSAAELLAGLRGDFVDREYLWSGKITPERERGVYSQLNGCDQLSGKKDAQALLRGLHVH